MGKRILNHCIERMVKLSKATEMKKLATQAKINNERMKQEQAEKIIKETISKIEGYAKCGDFELTVKTREMMGLDERIIKHFREEGFQVMDAVIGIVISWKNAEDE